MQQLGLFGGLQIGSKITARPDGTLRGGEILKINQDGSIKAVFYCPRSKEFDLDKDKFLLSSAWDDPDKRIEL